MNLKQWQHPEIKRIDVKETESGILLVPEEGVWTSQDGKTTIPTGSYS